MVRPDGRSSSRPTALPSPTCDRTAARSNIGLYVGDLSIRFSARILPIRSLTQRGIYSEPAWSPDGRRLAITVQTAYDLDIYTIEPDGSNPTAITRQGSYDFWPVWSPDGSYLAFVSDRARCPSWIPGEPGTCDGTDQAPPTGGNIFLLNLVNGVAAPDFRRVGERAARLGQPAPDRLRQRRPAVWRPGARAVDDRRDQRRIARGQAQ